MLENTDSAKLSINLQVKLVKAFHLLLYNHLSVNQSLTLMLRVTAPLLLQLSSAAYTGQFLTQAFYYALNFVIYYGA